MSRALLTVGDIRWLSGLLEGEGSFFFRVRAPRLSVGMKDRDVVARAAKLLGGGLWGPFKNGMYQTAVVSVVAAGWMMTLYGLMGERRRGQIRRTLARWREQRVHPATLRKWRAA